MNQLSTHNEADKNKEQAQVSKQSRVVSTRNVIPFNRPVTNEDVTTFVKKRDAIINGKTNAEIKPDVAKLDDEGKVKAATGGDEQKPVFTPEEQAAETPIIDYAAERAKVETPEEQAATMPDSDKPKRGRKPKDAQ